MLSFRRKEAPPIQVHVEVRNQGLEGKIDRILCLLEALKAQGVHMGAEQERVRQELAELREEIVQAGGRFSTLFEEYKAARDAGNDAEARDIADQLDALAQTLKAGTTKPEE